MWLSLIIDTISIVALCFVMVKAVTFLVTSSSKLARYLKISEYTLSILVVAFATSLPELAVGVVSALDQQSILSYGNVVGSNIADLTLMLAIPIFVGGALSTKELVKNRDLVLGTFLSLLPVALMFDGALTRLDGTLLVSGYFIYIISVLKRSEKRHFNLTDFVNHETNIAKETLILLLSAITMWISADMIVVLAQRVHTYLNVQLLLVGLILTAVGTSLPELIFGLRAVQTKHNGEIIGNLMGSVVANSTLILGITVMIYPLSFALINSLVSYVFLLATLLCFFIFSLTRKQVGRFEAVVLLLIYLLFVIATVV